MFFNISIIGELLDVFVITLHSETVTSKVTRHYATGRAKGLRFTIGTEFNSVPTTNTINGTKSKTFF